MCTAFQTVDKCPSAGPFIHVYVSCVSVFSFVFLSSIKDIYLLHMLNTHAYLTDLNPCYATSRRTPFEFVLSKVWPDERPHVVTEKCLLCFKLVLFFGLERISFLECRVSVSRLVGWLCDWSVGRLICCLFVSENEIFFRSLFFTRTKTNKLYTNIQQTIRET